MIGNVIHIIAYAIVFSLATISIVKIVHAYRRISEKNTKKAITWLIVATGLFSFFALFQFLKGLAVLNLTTEFIIDVNFGPPLLAIAFASIFIVANALETFSKKYGFKNK